VAALFRTAGATENEPLSRHLAATPNISLHFREVAPYGVAGAPTRRSWSIVGCPASVRERKENAFLRVKEFPVPNRQAKQCCSRKFPRRTPATLLAADVPQAFFSRALAVSVLARSCPTSSSSSARERVALVIACPSEAGGPLGAQATQIEGRRSN